MEERDFVHLLAEIRDLEREHLEEYRRVTQESLELQRRAVLRQEQLGRLYRRVVATGGLLIAAAVIYLIWFGSFR